MFLTTDDFKKVVSADNLTQILAQNPTLLHDMTLAAVAEAEGYLSGRYDVATEFEKTGEDRNPILVVRLIDMATYHVYTSISPRNIPDIRRDRYAESISWLKSVMKGDISLNLAVKEVAGQSGILLYGGNPKFNHR